RKPERDDDGEVEGAHGTADHDHRDEARFVVEAEVRKPWNLGWQRFGAGRALLGGSSLDVQHLWGALYWFAPSNAHIVPPALWLATCSFRFAVKVSGPGLGRAREPRRSRARQPSSHRWRSASAPSVSAAAHAPRP